MLDTAAAAVRTTALRTAACRRRPACPRPARIAMGAMLAVWITSSTAGAQLTNSYVDDSVLARESLSRASDLVAAGNFNEAARVMQAVLDTETDRVIESPADPALFIGVRQAVHAALLARPPLLERYRQREESVAEAMLRESRADEVERTRLLTRSGFEAALRIASDHFESARFEAARLTLEQLEAHPDRTDPEASASAADLACRLASYLHRDPVIAMAKRWTRLAGRDDPAIENIPWPQRWKDSFGRDSTSAGPEPAIQALVDGPLQSVFLSGDSAAEYRAFQELPRDDNLAAWLLPWTFPTVVGDDVLVNDGRAMIAFDRFTLAQRWRHDYSEAPFDPASTEPPDIRSITGSARIEDAATIAAGEGVAVAALGLQAQQLREGDNRLHAIELAGGEELWALPPGGLSDTLRLAEFRGPCVIDQSTVVQAFRKESAARRLGSTYLAGIDLWTGRTRWVRLICSAGTMGSFGSRPGEISVAHEGVIFRVDDSGVVSAVESVSGRLRWLRVFRGDWAMRVGDAGPPWAGQAPVIDGDSMIAINPIQQTIHRLSLADGAELAQRNTAGIPGPIFYMLAAGQGADRSLVTVTDNRMAVLPMESFHTSTAQLVPAVNEPGYRGRVVAMGGTLVAPISGGLLLASVADPGNPQVRPLENTGNIVASGSNLLIADTWRLHSYLSWDDADRLLSARIANDPKDPRPALALAELSYRAQRLDRLLPAVDQALAAMAAAPLSPAAQHARPRLFQSLLEMVQSSTQARPRPNLASRPMRLTDLNLVDSLVARMERVAESPTENIHWLVSLASLRELQSRGPEACRAYQRILEDEQLASTTWRDRNPPVPARQVAIDHLRSLVSTFGVAAYAPFAAELDAELAAMPAATTPQSLELLAARYPVAPRTPEVLLQAAALYGSANRPDAALAAIARASDTAWWLVSVGVTDQQSRLGETVGAHSQALAQIGRPMTAAQVLLRAARTRPGIAIAVGGTPINPTARAAELVQLARSAPRPPRLGSDPGRELSVLVGWTLLPPALDRSITPVTSHEWTVMVDVAGRRFAAFADQGSGTLTPAWTRPYQDLPPKVLHASPDRLIVLWDEDTSIERIDPATGETVWRSPPISRMLPPAPPSGVRMMDTPLDGQVRSIDLVPALSDQYLALSQRDGAAVVIETATGKVAWSARTDLTRVYDVSLAGPVLVMSGASDPTDNADPAMVDRRDQRVPPRPLLIAFDAASGRRLYDPIAAESDVRWTRSNGRVVVAALADRLRGIDPRTGKTLWQDVVGEDVSHAAEGWVFDDSIYVLSRRRELFRIDLASGQFSPLDLKAFDRLADGGQIAAGRVGPNIVFSTRQGVFILGRDGSVVGANSVSGRRDFMPAIAGRDVIALVERATDELPDGRSALRVMLVTADSAKLLRTLAVVVEGEPDSIATALLDGKLVLSTDRVTQVISLPAPHKP